MEVGLGVLVDDKWTVSWQWPCGQEGQWDPGLHWEECGQQVVRDVILPLYLALGRPHLERSVQFSSSVEERQAATGEGPEEATKC